MNGRKHKWHLFSKLEKETYVKSTEESILTTVGKIYGKIVRGKPEEIIKEIVEDWARLLVGRYHA